MPHSNSLCYEFGSFRLDVEQRVLTYDDGAVSLPPKATEILLVLLRNAGQLVEKEELMNEVWPNTFVEEANLPQNIFTLRRALGDERASPRYIETVPRRGYRFVEPVKKVNYADHETADLNSEKRKQCANGVLLSSPPTLAVLPFINATGDQSVEYLADGITDNITNNLSRISKLRVMSRSAVFRLSGKDLDPKEMGQFLGVDALLVGKIYSGPGGLAIKAELVEATNGWQLWGESFDCELDDILEVQDEIVRRLSATLQLKLTGDEERKITTRYTENSAAYQAYLEGRYHWSTYTREGIEKAIARFYHAIELDANYALAYSGIVDCYLRLATNYLPPEGDLSQLWENIETSERHGETQYRELYRERVRLRYEWDCKGAERELRRAHEFQSGYPWVHQWQVAYSWSADLFERSLGASNERLKQARRTLQPRYIQHPLGLMLNEEIQIFCAIAREQTQVGNYEAGRLMLQKWWTFGKWPILEGLGEPSAADLLLTVGTLAGYLSSTGHGKQGQKHAEALLSGCIAFFERLGSKARAAEGRIELARCYYREGLFDIARDTLSQALEDLPSDHGELRGVCLVLLGGIERDAGRLRDSFTRLNEAAETMEGASPLVTGRYHHELATTLKELAVSAYCDEYSQQSMRHFERAVSELGAIGNHRHTAAAENNLGYLLLTLDRPEESEFHLLRAKRLFDSLADKIRSAQVDDTLARLYLKTSQLGAAEQATCRAVRALEETDEEALLAEALTTQGLIFSKLYRYIDAKKSFEGSHRVAERCGDREGAGRALLTMLEEMSDHLEEVERQEAGRRLSGLLAWTQQASIVKRLQEALALIAPRNPEK